MRKQDVGESRNLAIDLLAVSCYYCSLSLRARARVRIELDYLLPPEADPAVVDEGGADGEVRDGQRGAHEERHVRLHGEHRVDEEDDDDELPDAVGLNKV